MCPLGLTAHVAEKSRYDADPVGLCVPPSLAVGKGKIQRYRLCIVVLRVLALFFDNANLLPPEPCPIVLGGVCTPAVSPFSGDPKKSYDLDFGENLRTLTTTAMIDPKNSMRILATMTMIC